MMVGSSGEAFLNLFTRGWDGLIVYFFILVSRWKSLTGTVIAGEIPPHANGSSS